MSVEIHSTREARLQFVRDNQAQRLSVQTLAAREARLQFVRDRGCLWRLMLLGMPDSRTARPRYSCCREARLQSVRENQTQRLSEETHASREAKTLGFEGQSGPDGRLIRLQILSTNQAQRLSDETCKRCMTGTGTLHSRKALVNSQVIPIILLDIL